MHWTELTAIATWLHHMEPMLSLAAGIASAGILFGCAVTCWFAPSPKKDCLFRRQVI